MSIAIIDLQRNFGNATSETLHLVHCPMAFDLKGADWLQRGEEISNPYFGESMLRCGTISDSFAPLNHALSHKGHADE